MFLNVVESVVLEAAKQGDGVIVGYGSQILLRDFDCAMHVRIHDSETHRAERLASSQGLSREAAVKLIRRRDKEQAGFYKFAFQLDIDDFTLYDLVIHTQKLNADTAAGLKDRPEARNLVNIYAALAGHSVDQVIQDFAGAQFGTFKPALADRGVMRLRLASLPNGLLDRVRTLAPGARWAGSDLLVPGPATARAGVLALVQAAGADVQSRIAEEGRLDDFYRELVGAHA